MRSLLAAFARNTVFANIVLVIIFLAGGMASYFMIRETFPEFSLDRITISVAYPGADRAATPRLTTIPVEVVPDWEL